MAGGTDGATREAERRQRDALRAMAADDPELAARLVIATLPGAAAQVPGELRYELEVEGLGAHRVEIADGAARVEPVDGDGGGGGRVDFRLKTDPRTLAELAAGASPVRLMLSGRLRVSGRRRRALRLRAMNGAGDGLAATARGGHAVDPALVYRALPYLVEPEWTRGHAFTIAYEIEGAGAWTVQVRDGEPLRVTSERADGADATVRMDADTFRRILARELTPPEAIRNHLLSIDGRIIPVTMLGRWTDRAQGADAEEMERERGQRERLADRGPTWGAKSPGGPAAGGVGGDGRAAAPAHEHGQGDPGHGAESSRREGGGLLDYQQLYALWERQNWKAHELDFSEDREQWMLTPGDAQRSTLWSLGSFYAGEERVTADLVPFVNAAPSGEIEVFLTTQVVDEARHAVFFDRFGAEVMALESGDLRGRLAEIEAGLEPAWRETFDEGLRDVATRLKAKPDDLDLFVEGVTTYHMVIEGLLATTGQLFIREYMEDHGLYPGFCRGFALVERDEHRHIAFGVRFLKEMVARDPGRYGRIVEDKIAALVPTAARVFAPPYADDQSDFYTYGYHSSEVYGHAYRAMKRRLTVVGVEVPPAEELMPGPIATPQADDGPGAAAQGGSRTLRTAKRGPGG